MRISRYLFLLLTALTSLDVIAQDTSAAVTSLGNIAQDADVRDVSETEGERQLRLMKIQALQTNFSLKLDEKFVYIGGDKTSYFHPMQVIYRDYSGSENDYIFIWGSTGDGNKVTFSSEFVRPLPSLRKDGIDSRINSSVMNKDTASFEAKSYGEKYEEYHQRHISFARKIIQSEVCDTVIYVATPNFGGQYLYGLCGDRKEVKQMLSDFEQAKPLSKTIKKTYLVLPKGTRNKLREESIRKIQNVR